MSRKLTAFLPCRKGSQRISRKNVRPFADVEGGLVEIKLGQLSKVEDIDSIVLSTNDPEVIDIAAGMNIASLIIDIRPDDLCASSTSTDALIRYVPSIINEGDILWTHVTSPFFDEERYRQVIEKYHDFNISGDFDSIMTVTEVYSFLWSPNGPLNYNSDELKWPRTQELEPIYEINSAAFLAPRTTYMAPQYNRIGAKPYFMVCSKGDAMDIDWPDDFDLAELVYRHRKRK